VGQAWWQSKKFLAVAANHILAVGLAVFGIVKQPEATGVIVSTTLGEIGTVSAAHQVSQAATDRARAYSPNYPTPPNPDPGNLQ